MRVLYSFLSLILSILIIALCTFLGGAWCKDAVLEFLEMIGRPEIFNNIVLVVVFIIIVAFLSIFGIIILLIVKKKVCYLSSSCVASGISSFATCVYLKNFNIVKHFYFGSNDFSNMVKVSFNRFFITELIIGFLLIIIGVTLFLVNYYKEEKK